MSHSPQVRGSAYVPFVQFMERLGAPFERQMEDGLVPAMVNRDQEALVPVHLAHSFLNRSARAAGISNFGFVVGRQARVENLGSFGRTLLRSLTLHDALGKIRSKFSLYSSAEQLWWIRAGSSVQFLHGHVYDTGSGGRYAQQCALLLMRDLVRLAAGPTWQPDEVLSTDPTLDALGIEEAFDGAAVRRAEAAGLVFPASFLSLPFAQSHRRAAPAGDLDVTSFEASTPAEDFVGSLRQVISALMTRGQCHLDDVADAVGMHPRTMQRRLAEAEQEYSEVLAQARFETALRLIDDARVNLTDIAYELGYTDSTNFTRAFRHWTGVSPSRFRKLRGRRDGQVST